jgi:DNA polymerase V
MSCHYGLQTSFNLITGNMKFKSPAVFPETWFDISVSGIIYTNIYEIIKGIYKMEVKHSRTLLFAEPVSAGFPSPASDYIEERLDLNEHLVKHPAATFFVRADGDSMQGAGIYNGDILVVDRSLEPADMCVVIATLESEFTVKRLRISNGKATLQPENQKYRPMEITEDSDFKIWGVVTYVIHGLVKCNPKSGVKMNERHARGG